MSLVFVFGSNARGIHGAGAAKYAREHYGARYGIGEGRQGDSYAIPTKDSPRKPRAFFRVALSVKRFLEYASEHPEDAFEVTKIGCGLAGFKEEEIAPLFKDAPPNCHLPKGWRTEPQRLTVTSLNGLSVEVEVREVVAGASPLTHEPR